MRRLRPATALVAALVVILGAVWLRAFTGARDALAAARVAEAAGDRDTAVARYQYAMRWYTPFASAPDDAAAALARMADEARAAGDRQAELDALRRLRGGIRATRSVFSPFDDRAAGVDARLAACTAEAQIAAGLGNGRDREALVTWHADLLALDPTPAPALALAATLGFLGWVAAAFGFLFRGLDADLRLVQPSARRWMVAFVSSFGVWMLGLWFA